MADRGYNNSGGGQRNSPYGGGGGNRRRSGGGGGGNRRDSGGGNRRDSGGGNRRISRGIDPVDDTEARLTTLLLRIGDKNTSTSSSTGGLDSDLSELASVLEADIPANSKQLVGRILDCVFKHPVKTPLYGTLVGLLNLASPEFGVSVVSRIYTELNAALTSEDAVHKVKVLVRFVGELMNCNLVKSSAVVGLLELFLNRAFEERKKTSKGFTLTGDFYVFVVLSTLPWVGQDLDEHCSDGTTALFDSLAEYMQGRDAECVRDMVVGQACFSDVDVSMPDALSLLSSQIQTLRAAEWPPLSVISRPHLAFATRFDAEANQAPVPEGVTFAENTAGWSFPLPRPSSRLFSEMYPASDSSENASIEQLELHILETYVLDLLTGFPLDPKECTRQILTIAPSRHDFEKIIAQTLFSELLRVPAPVSPPVFVGVVLMNACKSIRTFPPCLGQSIVRIFDRLSVLEISSARRFSGWFAFHLSNFDFKWNWNHWDRVLEQSEHHPQRAFVRDVFAATTRLSYLDRIRKSVPEVFYGLLPPAPTPAFAYTGDTDAISLIKACRSKQTPEEVVTLIDQTNATNKMDMAVNCFLNIGCKTISHLGVVLDRYHTVLTDARVTSADASADDDQRQDTILTSTSRFWASSPFHMRITFEHLLTYGAVSARAVVVWLFLDANMALWSRHSAIEILVIALAEEGKEEDVANETFALVMQKFAWRLSEHAQEGEGEDMFSSFLGYMKEVACTFPTRFHATRDALASDTFGEGEGGADCEVDERVVRAFRQAGVACLGA